MSDNEIKNCCAGENYGNNEPTQSVQPQQLAESQPEPQSEDPPAQSPSQQGREPQPRRLKRGQRSADTCRRIIKAVRLIPVPHTGAGTSKSTPTGGYAWPTNDKTKLAIPNIEDGLPYEPAAKQQKTTHHGGGYI